MGTQHMRVSSEVSSFLRGVAVGVAVKVTTYPGGSGVAIPGEAGRLGTWWMLGLTRDLSPWSRCPPSSSCLERREGLAPVTLTVGGDLSRSGMPTEMFARLL